MDAFLVAVATLTDEAYTVARVHHEVKSGGTLAFSVALIGGSDMTCPNPRLTACSATRVFVDVPPIAPIHNLWWPVPITV
jgi:hypothetical protein